MYCFGVGVGNKLLYLPKLANTIILIFLIFFLVQIRAQNCPYKTIILIMFLLFVNTEMKKI